MGVCPRELSCRSFSFNEISEIVLLALYLGSIQALRRNLRLRHHAKTPEASKCALRSHSSSQSSRNRRACSRVRNSSPHISSVELSASNIDISCVALGEFVCSSSASTGATQESSTEEIGLIDSTCRPRQESCRNLRRSRRSARGFRAGRSTFCDAHCCQSIAAGALISPQRVKCR